MPTIGQKLEQTRLGLGLTVEDVAHETRIHPGMIRSIEADDFSRFPSVAYAKSFIRKYSGHLGLDLEGAMDALNSGVVRVDESDLMGGMGRGGGKKARRLRSLWAGPRRARRAVPWLLNLVLVSLSGALGIFYFLGYHAPTPERAKEDIARSLGLPLPTPDGDAPAITPLLGGTPSPENQAGETPAKPVVELPFDDAPSLAPPTDAAPRPRPREAGGLDLATDRPTLPRLGDLPSAQPAAAEPQAVLRPEGTDPAATTREPEPAPVAPPGRGSEEAPAPSKPALRAVPVAASE